MGLNQRRRKLEREAQRRLAKGAHREIARATSQAKRAERCELVQLLGESRADELLSARREQNLCECPGGVAFRRYASQDETEAAKAEPGKVCKACRKEIVRVFLFEPVEVE
jgi:hypothetical protein